MKASMIKILSDDDQLREYIASLEDDIEKTELVDTKLDMVLDNILKMFDNFKDRRALKSTNIEAITNMLKLKSDLPMKRIQTKKMIMELMTKKNELELRKRTADATSQLAGGTVDILRAIYMQLDQKQIHPKIVEADVLQLECKDIIDVVAVEKKEEVVIDEDPEVTDIVAIQKQLDITDYESIDSEEENNA